MLLVYPENQGNRETKEKMGNQECQANPEKNSKKILGNSGENTPLVSGYSGENPNWESDLIRVNSLVVEMN